MRPQVVHEFGRVRHEPVAVAVVLTLEQFREAIVTSMALEEVDNVGGGVGDLPTGLQVLCHIEVLACDALNLPILLDTRELLCEFASELFRKHSVKGHEVRPVEELDAAALGFCDAVCKREI